MHYTKRLFAWLSQDDDLMRLLRGSLMARGIGAMSGLLLQVAVARTLGVDGTGIFFLCAMTMTLCAILAKCGLDNLLLRQASTAWEKREMLALGGIYAQVITTAMTLACVAAVCLFMASDWLAYEMFDNAAMANPLKVFSIALLPTVLIWVQAAMLKAMGKPGRAALVEVAMLPVLSLMIGWSFYEHQALHLYTACLAYLAGCMLAALCSFISVLRDLPLKAIRLPARAFYLPRASIDLTCIELVQFMLAMATLPLVGLYLSTADAGIMGVALKVTAQITIIGVLVGSLISPRLATCYQAGDMLGMQRVAQRGAQFLLLLSLPALGMMLLFPGTVVWTFGAEFDGVQTPLRILILGQLVKALCGPAGYCLIMAGRERVLRQLLLLTVGLGLPITAMLVLEYGLVGAAIGSAGMLAFQSISATLAVRKHLNIRTYLAPWFRKNMELSAAMT